MRSLIDDSVLYQKFAHVRKAKPQGTLMRHCWTVRVFA